MCYANFSIRYTNSDRHIKITESVDQTLQQKLDFPPGVCANVC